jgi:hypothetical protein
MVWNLAIVKAQARKLLPASKLSRLLQRTALVFWITSSTPGAPVDKLCGADLDDDAAGFPEDGGVFHHGVHQSEVDWVSGNAFRLRLLGLLGLMGRTLVMIQNTDKRPLA